MKKTRMELLSQLTGLNAFVSKAPIKKKKNWKFPNTHKYWERALASPYLNFTSLRESAPLWLICRSLCISHHHSLHNWFVFLVIYCRIFEFKADSRGGFGAFHFFPLVKVWFPWLSFFQFQFLWETQFCAFLFSVSVSEKHNCVLFCVCFKSEGDFSHRRKLLSCVSVSHFRTPQVTSLSLNLMYNSLYLFIIIVTYNL